MIMEAKREYKSTCRQACSWFLQNLDRYRTRHEVLFWDVLSTAPAHLCILLQAFYDHFRSHFTTGHVDFAEPVCDTIATTVHTPFIAEEVQLAVGALAHRKSAGLAICLADDFRGAQNIRLYTTVAQLFDRFA